MQITQLMPAIGDWFSIESDDCLVSLGRVCVWAVIDDEQVQGIDTAGSAFYDDMHLTYVHGDDLAPNGKTWKQIFDELPPGRHNRRDLSDMPGLDPQKW